MSHYGGTHLGIDQISTANKVRGYLAYLHNPDPQLFRAVRVVAVQRTTFFAHSRLVSLRRLAVSQALIFNGLF